jgi:hypothetical protein
MNRSNKSSAQPNVEANAASKALPGGICGVSVAALAGDAVIVVVVVMVASHKRSIETFCIPVRGLRVISRSAVMP